MKKRLLPLLMAIVMCLSLTIPAGATTFTKNTSFTKLANIYDDVIVKTGVTLTLKNWSPDPQGLEIKKSLVVEPGGCITGGIIIFYRGATSSGLDLYYKVAGKEKLLTVSLADVIAAEPSADYRPTFNYDTSTGHYVLQANYASDPFETPPPADPGGSLSGAPAVDQRTLDIARGLKSLGLFKGVVQNAYTSEDFALDSPATRAQAVVLLIRLLGKDAEAVAYPAERCPFDDTKTLRNYLAYAYDNGLSQGTDPAHGVFGTGNATAKQFLAFVLRAMGYRDNTQGGTDFQYADTIEFARSRGLIGGDGDLQNFNRGACVRIMEAALRNSMPDGRRLYQKLVEDGVFTEEQYRAALGGV